MIRIGFHILSIATPPIPSLYQFFFSVFLTDLNFCATFTMNVNICAKCMCRTSKPYILPSAKRTLFQFFHNQPPFFPFVAFAVGLRISHILLKILTRTKSLLSVFRHFSSQFHLHFLYPCGHLYIFLNLPFQPFLF